VFVVSIKHFEEGADVSDLGLDHAPEEAREGVQLPVVRVTRPGQNLDTVARLAREVIRDVVHYKRFREVTPQTREVLHVDSIICNSSVLPIEPMHNQVFLGV